jgi:hypothetical protein
MTYEHFYYKGYGCDLDGTLYSTKGKRKTVVNSSSGYQATSVRKDGKTVQYRAHRFIYECITRKFIPDGMVINHLDGNKLNNHFDNLELCTYSENTQHAFSIGLITPLVGEMNGCARITAEIVRNIIRDIVNGFSNTELATKYSLDLKHISLIRNKKRWKFIFEENEFRSYKPIKNVQGKLSKEERDSLNRDILTSATNVELARKYNVDTSIISRKRSKLNQESSETIPEGSTLEANASGSGIQSKD